MAENQSYIGRSVLLYVTGMIIILTSQHVVKPFIDAVGAVTPTPAFESYLWLGVILGWVIIGVVMPAFYTITTLRNAQLDKRKEYIILGILMFIFGILITIKAWYMAGAVATLIINPLGLAIFWIGLAINWIMWVLVTPIYLIVNGLDS